MNSININTSQNVNISFPTASIGDRMVALIIDTAIKAGNFLTLAYFLFEVSNINFYKWDDWEVIAFWGVITLPVTFYTLIFETLMEGQTPGKKAMNCKVVKIDGYQAEFLDYLIRWAFRIIDILISSGVIGLITILVSEKQQRLGGLASGTAVISLKQKTFLSQTLFAEIEEDYLPMFPQVRLITDNDMRIIVKNYQEANREKRFDIIQKLAEKIREITDIPNQNPKMNDKDFIKRVIEDFNHYTGKE